MENQLILNHKQTEQKIRRIAFEIYENNHTEKTIYIAGVWDKGYELAQLIQNEMKKLAPIETELIKIELDKFAPLQSEIKLDISIEKVKNKVVVLVDDVLNSGRTLVYCLKPFLNIEIKKIQVAVLVDRGYSSFPVKADFVGYSLSTTLKEHVEVQIKDSENLAVYLQ